MALVLMNDFTFKVDYDKQKAALIQYDGFAEDVKIPSAVNECSVISIHQSVFENNQTIKNVILPMTLQFVGARAFKGSSVEQIHLDGQKTSNLEPCIFYHSAFMDCKKLQKVYFGKIVHFSDWNIFANCTSLKAVSCDKIMYNIPKYSFLNCTSLKHITTMHPVNIEEKAFCGCNISTYSEFDTNSTYAEDFADSIHDATIHCYESSDLANLAYLGEKVIFMQ